MNGLKGLADDFETFMHLARTYFPVLPLFILGPISTFRSRVQGAWERYPQGSGDNRHPIKTRVVEGIIRNIEGHPLFLLRTSVESLSNQKAGFSPLGVQMTKMRLSGSEWKDRLDVLDSLITLTLFFASVGYDPQSQDLRCVGKDHHYIPYTRPFLTPLIDPATGSNVPNSTKPQRRSACELAEAVHFFREMGFGPQSVFQPLNASSIHTVEDTPESESPPPMPYTALYFYHLSGMAGSVTSGNPQAALSFYSSRLHKFADPNSLDSVDVRWLKKIFVLL